MLYAVEGIAQVGHASITITLDHNGHPLPRSEDVAADLFNAYLAKAAT